mmetsp:Transcript_60890/g.168502  ORF Transcript_60890/g.168502 Transcript_60890/m.168502 type:complete len:230 (+) Transcript_60890:281-970(+)
MWWRCDMHCEALPELPPEAKPHWNMRLLKSVLQSSPEHAPPVTATAAATSAAGATVSSLGAFACSWASTSFGLGMAPDDISSSSKRLGGHSPAQRSKSPLQWSALHCTHLSVPRQLPMQQSRRQWCAPQLISPPRQLAQPCEMWCRCTMHCAALPRLPPEAKPHWNMRLLKSLLQLSCAQAPPVTAAAASTSGAAATDSSFGAAACSTSSSEASGASTAASCAVSSATS